MIICIDGANGVGKSTILKELLKNYKNFVLFEDDEISKIASEIGFLNARKLIQKKFLAYENVIICRWFASMYVFDYKKNLEKFLKDKKLLINPDYTIVIGCKLNLLLKRIKQRKNFSLKKDLQEQLQDFNFIANYLQYDYMENNNSKDLKLILQKIKEKLKEIKDV